MNIIIYQKIWIDKYTLEERRDGSLVKNFCTTGLRLLDDIKEIEKLQSEIYSLQQIIKNKDTRINNIRLTGNLDYGVEDE